MKAATDKKRSRFDEIEIDRKQGQHIAAVVVRLVEQLGGTKAAIVAIGLSSGCLGRLRNPRPLARYCPSTLDAIARAAGVTRAELLSGKGPS